MRDSPTLMSSQDLPATEVAGNAYEVALRRLPGLFPVVAMLLILLLAACDASSAPLSNVRASSGEIQIGSTGISKPPGVVEVRYRLGSAQVVNIQLLGDGENKHNLFSARQEAGEHVFRFNGVISASQAEEGYRVVRRVVPDGEYNLMVSSEGQSASLPLKVSGSDQEPPSLGNILVRPDAISPNSDAVDDVAEVTFRTDQTATLSVDLTSPDGARIPMFAPTQKGRGEQNVVINGHDTLGEVLPDGTYTVTLRAQDRAGNRVEAQRPITIRGGGKPELEVVRVEITPQQLILGEAISVSITVKNIGNVPIRTQGPDPGFTYTTNDTYSSIEGGKWDNKAGLWRAGIDWDGNSGGGPSRYPFRWGFKDTLMPGQEFTTGGKIVILKQERQMWFYAGILQEGVRIALDRLGRTRVDVSF
jgi:hypothetical protein